MTLCRHHKIEKSNAVTNYYFSLNPSQDLELFSLSNPIHGLVFSNLLSDLSKQNGNLPFWADSWSFIKFAIYIFIFIGDYTFSIHVIYIWTNICLINNLSQVLPDTRFQFYFMCGLVLYCEILCLNQGQLNKISKHPRVVFMNRSL